MKHKQEGILYWSYGDQAFAVNAPELPGSTAHGEDQETVLRNFKDTMGFWIERARELGQPVPKPKGKSLMPA